MQPFIPRWISCKSYILNERKGLAIISNQITHKYFLLKDESAYIWSLIEQDDFETKLAIDYLKQIGSTNPDIDLQQFFDSLLVEQCLVTENPTEIIRANPAPTYEEHVAISNINPALNESDREIEDEASIFAEQHGFLYSGFWEVTNRCNEKCVHCFNPGAPHTVDEKSNRDMDELSTDEGIAMISNLRKSGAYRLVMSGGEVFLRKDIWRLIEHARSLRMQVHIYTNGLLLDEGKLEKLAKLYPETVSVSIYSAIPEVHDEITKVPGSFNKSINALKKLNQLGIKTTIKSIQMKHTVQGYGLIENIAKSIGARYSTEINMSAGNDGSQSPLALAIDDDKKLIALAVTPKSPIFVGDASNNYSEKKRKGDEIFCSAGQNMVSISPDGKIYPCVALPLEVGNIRSDDLNQVWAASSVGQRKGQNINETYLEKELDPLSKWQNARVSSYVECGTHDRCSWCHKCPGMGMNETGNPMAASKVQCKIANARMVGAQKLKSGMSQEDIFKELGIEDNFGYSNTTLSVPEMTVQFVKKTDWLKVKIKEQISSP